VVVQCHSAQWQRASHWQFTGPALSPQQQEWWQVGFPSNLWQIRFRHLSFASFFVFGQSCFANQHFVPVHFHICFSSVALRFALLPSLETSSPTFDPPAE